MVPLLMIIVLFSVIFMPDVSAQNKKVEKLVEKGNKHYNKERFEKAQQFYLKALEVDSTNVEANIYAGIELLKTAQKWKALSYIKKAYTIDPEVNDQINFYLGVAYQYNYEFEKALYHLEEAQKAHQHYSGEEWKEIYFRIQQCKNSIKLRETNREFRVENMGPDVNSTFRDYAPVINPMQDKIIFASNRREVKKEKHRVGKYFMDIYIVNKDGDKWHPAKKIDKALKTSYDDMGLSFDREGKKLLVYKTKNYGDIYIAELAAGQWSRPESLGSNINTPEYTEISASLSPDGNAIFFTSNRPGGSGGMDLYVSYRDEKGNWRKAQNLGSDINTAGDEETPFLSLDGKMLFFSSDGHPGIGGLDIFYSRRDEKTGAWGKPQNMGFPVNSPEDDINFVLSNDGLSGYYTATRTDTYGGEDIYKVSMSHPETENPSLLASIYNAAPNDLTSEVKYAAITAIPADEIREKRSSRENEVQTHITLAVNKEHDGSNITRQALSQNVYFDNRRAELKPGSFEYLNQVAAYMKEHGEVKLELAGHTDDIGSASFNTDLSWERAGAVFQYLIRKGIEPSQMVMKGYGKAKPLATNDDEREGRELNRRVEFNILPSYNDSLTGGNSYTSNLN